MDVGQARNDWEEVPNCRIQSQCYETTSLFTALKSEKYGPLTLCGPGVGKWRVNRVRELRLLKDLRFQLATVSIVHEKLINSRDFMLLLKQGQIDQQV